jgi:carboxypeptidase C (cathepsin A)
LSGIGPISLNSDLSQAQNPNTFTTYTNVMFLDLLGSGFSFAANVADIPSDAKTYGVQLEVAITTLIK